MLSLDFDSEYQRCPWLCLEATIKQRHFELSQAFLCFGIEKFYAFDYPNPLEEEEIERLVAQLQMYLLLVSTTGINNLYYDGSDKILSKVCGHLEGIVGRRIKYGVPGSVPAVTLSRDQIKRKLKAFKEIKEYCLLYENDFDLEFYEPSPS